MFILLLEILFSHLSNRNLLCDAANLLHKNKHGVYGIGHFRTLKVLNAELKNLAKVQANRLQVMLDRLVFPEQTCS